MTATPVLAAQDFGKVAVLMGGRSAEREISLLSGTGVLNALQSRGVDAYAFDPADRALEELRRDGVARCFVALHGRHGEDGTVQGALELLGIPYTGSGVMASAIALDKVMTKRIWRFEDIPTPQWCQVRSAQQTREALAALGAPMIVKPACEGSTLGLTKVSDVAQCDAAYALAARHDTNVLAEQFIHGDELTVPVFADAQGVRAMPVIHIIAPDGNYDYQNKYFTDDTRYLCPSGLPPEVEAAIQHQAVRAFEVLGCRSCARVDVMLHRDRDGRAHPYLLEINTSPGMTGHSLVPMSAKAMGWSFDELCVRILATAALDSGLGVRPGAAV